MRFAIVEDSNAEREHLTELLQEYCRANGIEASLFSFDSGEAFLADETGGFDLALLDIEMAALNGMETARRLREKDKNIQIIFTTHLVQYAIAGYAVDAVDFIAKPVTYPALSDGLDRAMRRIRLLAPRFLMTSWHKEPISCQIRDITFIESLSKRTIIHMADGQALYASEALYALEERLCDEPFFRCHNAYLVNLAHVNTVGAAEISMQGERIPVSKYRRRAFLERLAAFRGEVF